MKFPLSWLKEYINPNLSVEEIGSKLTSAGLEVDSIQNIQGTQSLDSIFEIGLTPNLGHCASLIGVARELSASIDKPVSFPKINLKEDSNEQIAKQIKVRIENHKGCRRYSCRLIKDVVIGPSPEWMKKRLEDCGLRPVNNVVDIVNYVVMEFGLPLHAFEYDALEGHEIIVRAAKSGEKFVTLDEKERLLQDGDILICDKNKPVALAGVMGGLNSEVKETTKNVLLEAAYFHPGTIRKTSKRLGLSTDASKRFERGADPNQVVQSLNRAAMLLQEIAKGRVVSGILDQLDAPFEEARVTCRLKRINHLLGTQIGVSEVESIFKRLGMASHWDGQDLFTVTVPTYRVDISTEIDLIEEVARTYGYDNIGKSSQDAVYRASTLPHTPAFYFEQKVRDRLIAEGLQEFITCDLIGPTITAIVKDDSINSDAVVKVLNPVSVEQSILRTSMLPGLLQVAKNNFDHQNLDVSGFELGRIHFKDGDGYKEQTVFGIILMGKSHPHNWKNKPHEVDFYDLKGMIENILNELNVKNFSFKESLFQTLHSGRQASIFVDALELGSFGEVHPSILRRLDVSQRIYFAEISLQDLQQVRSPDQKMTPLAIYPCSKRDWTVTVSEDVTIESLMTKIHSQGSKLLEDIHLLDIYRSEKLGTGKKNVTLHFIYRDKNKTIEQEAVDAEHKRIISVFA
jgi:phenylalanyl-tRNA synthetase beta chain